MIPVDKFGSEEEHQDLAYHLNGLIEANEEIGQLARALASALAKDIEQKARLLSLLEVEIYDHLAYHLKELRRPLVALRRSAYKSLENKAGTPTVEEELERFQQLLSNRRAELNAEHVGVSAPKRKRARPKTPDK